MLLAHGVHQYYKGANYNHEHVDICQNNWLT